MSQKEMIYPEVNAETIAACGETEFIEADSFEEMIALARNIGGSEIMT